ncbi:MAG: heme exporter protein CcmB [Candidatus Puniceispirillaceae bacterium]
MLLALFKRDVLLALKRPSEVLTPVGFFLMISTLFPLAIGPEADTLKQIQSAILWIAVLLAAMPSFDRLYTDDYESGFLDIVIMRQTSLWAYAFVRLVSHFVIMGVPLIITLPVLALFFSVEAKAIPLLCGIICIGLFSLTLLGSVAASLTLGARRSGVLSFVLILPLAFPLLIFGTLASQALLGGAPYHAHLALLASSCLFLSVISPAATFYALRIAIEER